MGNHEKISTEELEEFDDFEEPVRDKPAYSKLIVAVCLVLVLAFTVTCLVYLWFGKPLNDTLTAFFFACFGVEFASLAFVTRGKLKYTGGNGVNRQVGHIETEEDHE
jgi:O-antigen/teichoic acid export membrane protein